MKHLTFLLFLISLFSLTACSEDIENLNPDQGSAANLSLSLCAAAHRCNPSLDNGRCDELLDGSVGASVWPRFGLPAGAWTTSLIDAKLGVTDLHVNHPAYEECQRSFVEVCDSEGEKIDSLTYESVGELIPGEGPCPEVFQ